MLRYRLAGPALAAHRMWRRIVPNGAGLRILLFHDVPDSEVSAFERLILYVKGNHALFSPNEAAAWIEGAAPAVAMTDGHLPCLFSFDDGFQSNFELATTVLANYAVKALFFINPSLVELTDDKQRAAIASGIFDGRIGAEQLDPALKIMTWDQIRALESLGHTIGCHGMNHQRLSLLEGDELRHEIVAAGDLLNDRLGEPAKWYAYAFGDVDSISVPALDAISVRYRYCRSGVRGLNTPSTHRLTLSADAIDLKAPLVYQKLVIEGGLDGLYSNARRQLRQTLKS